MSRLRVSIAGLLGMLFFCAVVFAALRSASNDWFKSLYTLTFIVLLCGLIAARYRGAFWYGFAVVGWAYFLVGFSPWIDNQGPGAINRNLVTAIVPEIVAGVWTANESATSANPQIDTMMRDLRRANRAGICHAALTIVAAFAGGIVAKFVEAHSRFRSETRESDSSLRTGAP